MSNEQNELPSKKTTEVAREDFSPTGTGSQSADAATPQRSAKDVVGDVVEAIKQKPYILVLVLLSIASLPILGPLGGGLRVAALRSGGLIKTILISRLMPLAKRQVEELAANVREDPRVLVELARRIETLPLPSKLQPAASALSKVAGVLSGHTNT